MTCGLSSLVDNLDEFPILSKYFEGRQLELLRRKGVYPYEYVDRLSKLEEKQLPHINRLYSHLTEEGISEDDYEHAQIVWEEFKIKSMRGYHDLYLESDVLLLRMYLKISETYVLRTISWIQHGTILRRV